MSAIVWVNILLTLPFLIAFIGLPLWLTFHRPETAPDHTEARAYLDIRTTVAATPAHRHAQRVKIAA